MIVEERDVEGTNISAYYQLQHGVILVSVTTTTITASFLWLFLCCDCCCIVVVTDKVLLFW
jgi:hypothetical protein